MTETGKEDPLDKVASALDRGKGLLNAQQERMQKNYNTALTTAVNRVDGSQAALVARNMSQATQETDSEALQAEFSQTFSTLPWFKEKGEEKTKEITKNRVSRKLEAIEKEKGEKEKKKTLQQERDGFKIKLEEVLGTTQALTENPILAAESAELIQELEDAKGILRDEIKTRDDEIEKMDLEVLKKREQNNKRTALLRQKNPTNVAEKVFAPYAKNAAQKLSTPAQLDMQYEKYKESFRGIGNIPEFVYAMHEKYNESSGKDPIQLSEYLNNFFDAEYKETWIAEQQQNEKNAIIEAYNLHENISDDDLQNFLKKRELRYGLPKEVTAEGFTTQVKSVFTQREAEARRRDEEERQRQETERQIREAARKEQEIKNKKEELALETFTALEVSMNELTDRITEKIPKLEEVSKGAIEFYNKNKAEIDGIADDMTTFSGNLQKIYSKEYWMGDKQQKRKKDMGILLKALNTKYGHLLQELKSALTNAEQLLQLNNGITNNIPENLKEFTKKGDHIHFGTGKTDIIVVEFSQQIPGKTYNNSARQDETQTPKYGFENLPIEKQQAVTQSARKTDATLKKLENLIKDEATDTAIRDIAHKISLIETTKKGIETAISRIST